MAMAGSHGLMASASLNLITTVNSVAAPSNAVTISNGIRAAKSGFSARWSVIFRYFVPVYHVPPCLDVIGTTILVVQIVGVFPNVETENRRVDRKSTRLNSSHRC